MPEHGDASKQEMLPALACHTGWEEEMSESQEQEH